MEELTIRQAFDAMVFFLENYYLRTKSDDVGALLGDLSFQIWQDSMTGDPAAWDDWMESVQKVLMPDTLGNQHMLEQLVSKPANYLGSDMWHNDWYGELLPDGRQLWAKVRNNKIKYGGLRKIPKSFDPKTGLSSPSDP